MDRDAKVAWPAGPALLKLGRRALAVLLFAAAFCFPAAGNTSIFTNAGTACTATTYCTALSQFGVLTGVRDSVAVNGNWDFGSGVGIGIQTGSTLKVLGTTGNANT